MAGRIGNGAAFQPIYTLVYNIDGPACLQAEPFLCVGVLISIA